MEPLKVFVSLNGLKGDDFEKERKRILDQFLESAPSKIRAGLKELQNRIDKISKNSSSPEVAASAILSLAMANLGSQYRLLKDLEIQATNEAVREKAENEITHQ